MKKNILLFILTSTHIMMGQNLIENPGFESGTTATTINQVNHATGWSNGCQIQFLGTNYCSPDLYDKNGYRSCFVENVILPRVNGATNNRYVHMFNNSDPGTGESVKGTITEALSINYSYKVSCYVSRTINSVTSPNPSYIQNPNLQLEFVLRNNDNCDLGKIVYTSDNVVPVAHQNECNGNKSTDWRQKLGYFNLDIADVNKGYNRLEIRIKGTGTLLNPIFIDDVELRKVPKVKASFFFTNPNQNLVHMNSLYGKTPVTQICQTLPKTCVTIDGSASTNEDGYYIGITPWDLTTWTATGAPLFNNWVCTGCTAGPKNLCDLTNLTGTSFLPNVVYRITLAVGPIWDAVDHFIIIKPTPTIGAIPNQTICNGDDTTFNVSTSSWPVSVYNGASLVGTFYSNPIVLSPTSTTNYTFKVTNFVKYGCSARRTVRVTVKNCPKACFEIKNIYSQHTEPSVYGPKPVKKLCLPRIEIDGSCSTNENGYHIRIAEFSFSPWQFVTDYYNGWVAAGAAPNTINLSSLISVPSANNGWTSRTFNPTKLYAVGLNVGPVWNSAPLQFFRVQHCKKINVALDKENNSFSIYPNPTRDYVRVTFNKPETGTLDIYSFDGQAIYSESFNDNKSLSFNLSAHKRGIYLARVTIGDKVKTYKIIKE